jgi:acyl carrier protein
MEEQKLFEKLREIIVLQLGIPEEEVTRDADFVNDFGADSLDPVELTMACEEAFEIDFPHEDTYRIRTVQDALDYLGPRLLEASGQQRLGL